MGSTSVKAPPPRNYQREMEMALSAQGAIQGKYLDLESLFRPQYRALQREDLLGTLGTYQDFLSQASGGAAQQAGQFAQGFSPVMGQIAQGAQQGYLNMMGPQAQQLYQSMNQQALEELNAGFGLTQQQNVLAQQQARAAMEARGLSGNQAVASEVLNSYAMAQARQDRARQYAQSVMTSNQNVANAGFQLLGAPIAQVAMDFNPMNALQLSSGLQQQVGSVTSPESEYMSDLIGANQSMQMQAAAASAANRAAMTGAGVGMLGAVGGGLLSNPKLFA